MADGLNKVMLLGNLGADPELRMSAGGTAVLKLRLATSEKFKGKDGSYQERTEWHSVVVFGKRAEALGKFLSKGSRLFVDGGLRTSTYEDRDGNKRYRTEIVANDIILAGGRRDGERSQSAPTGGGGFDDAEYGETADDDGIPF